MKPDNFEEVLNPQKNFSPSFMDEFAKISKFRTIRQPLYTKILYSKANLGKSGKKF